MLGDFHIQSAAQEILSSGSLVETETLSLESPTVEGGSSNILINGNVTAGAAVRGTQSLLVKGSLIGSERWPCRIEVDGDVVVFGDVKYAHVTGRSIRIGADARHCRLTAQRGLEVGKDLSNARIEVGEFDSENRKIEEAKQKILQTKQEGELIERQLRRDEKSMHKKFSSTHFDLNFSAGGIIEHMRSGIVINLQRFYKVVGERSDKEIDQALLEFFAKSVVGFLVRSNHRILKTSKGRQKAFKNVIRSLHDLFFLTREFDKQSSRIAQCEAGIDNLIDALSSQTSPVYVRGAMTPGIDLSFVLPEIERLEDEDEKVFIGRGTVKLTARPGKDAHLCEVTCSDTGGQDTVSNPGSEELQGILIQVHEGRAVWEPINMPVEEGLP